MVFKREQGCFELFLNSYKPQWGKKCSLHSSVNEPQTIQLITVVRSLILELQVFFRAFSHVLNFRKQREQKNSKAVQFSVQMTDSSVQSLSRVRLFATLWTTARQASLSITDCRSLPKPMSIESVIPSYRPHPLPSPSPPALNLSQHGAKSSPAL